MTSTPALLYSFSSGSTMIASEYNEQNALVPAWFTGNNFNFTINNFHVITSLNVSSLSLNTLVFTDAAAVSEVTFDSCIVNVNSSFTVKKFGLGAYTSSATISNEYFVPTSSFSANNNGGNVYRMVAASLTTVENEVIVVITNISGGSLIIHSGYEEKEYTEGTGFGFRLNADSITLDSQHDKLVVQLSKDAYNGNYYWQQISFQENA